MKWINGYMKASNAGEAVNERQRPAAEMMDPDMMMMMEGEGEDPVIEWQNGVL